MELVGGGPASYEAVWRSVALYLKSTTRSSESSYPEADRRDTDWCSNYGPLKIELAAVVDAGKSMAESTYILEQMVPLYRNSMSSCHLSKTVLTQPIFLMWLYSGIQRHFSWQSTCSAAVARSRTASYSTWIGLVPTNHTRNYASSNGNVHGQRGCQPIQDFPITPCCKWYWQCVIEILKIELPRYLVKD